MFAILTSQSTVIHEVSTWSKLYKYSIIGYHNWVRKYKFTVLHTEKNGTINQEPLAFILFSLP